MTVVVFHGPVERCDRELRDLITAPTDRPERPHVPPPPRSSQ